MRPMKAAANAENTEAFNITGLSISQAKHLELVLAVSPDKSGYRTCSSWYAESHPATEFVAVSYVVLRTSFWLRVVSSGEKK